MKYSPHKYQTYATDFILEHPVSAVFLDMGLGKSVITLTAIFDLCLDSFLVRKVLVIAPLRVAADTWPGEIEKWDHLRGLTYSVAVGSEAQRKAALLQRARVYIINRENVQWLLESSGLPFDYDMVVIDELSSFKSYCAENVAVNTAGKSWRPARWSGFAPHSIGWGKHTALPSRFRTQSFGIWSVA